MKKNCKEGIGSFLMNTGIPIISHIGSEMVVSEANKRMRTSLEKLGEEMKPIQEMIEKAAAEKGISVDELIKQSEERSAKQRQEESEKLSMRIAEARQKVANIGSDHGMNNALEVLDMFTDARASNMATLYQSMDSAEIQQAETDFQKATQKASEEFEKHGLNLNEVVSQYDRTIDNN